VNRNSGVYGINLFINARVDFESGEIGVEESENPKYEREREAVAAGILGFGGEGEYGAAHEESERCETTRDLPAVELSCAGNEKRQQKRQSRALVAWFRLPSFTVWGLAEPERQVAPRDSNRGRRVESRGRELTRLTSAQHCDIPWQRRPEFPRQAVVSTSNVRSN
jgi:hypothetical protein